MWKSGAAVGINNNTVDRMTSAPRNSIELELPRACHSAHRRLSPLSFTSPQSRCHTVNTSNSRRPPSRSIWEQTCSWDRYERVCSTKAPAASIHASELCMRLSLHQATTKAMDSTTIDEPALADAGIMDTTMDDLFGDVADGLGADLTGDLTGTLDGGLNGALSVSLPQVPLPTESILRIDELRSRGCCS